MPGPVGGADAGGMEAVLLLVTGLVLGLGLGVAAACALLRRRAERLLTRDPVTGALSRWAVDRRLADDPPAAVVVADVDGLKQLNDRHGHAAGDLALRAMTERLRRVSGAPVGRLGGDELLALCDHERQAADVAPSLTTTIGLPDGTPAIVTASTGACTCPAHRGPAALACADARMYEVKQQRSRPEHGSGGHVVTLYEDDAFLVDTVASFLEPALAGRGAAVVVATPDHCEALRRELGLLGLGRRSTDRLVLLDAAETLGAFMRGGRPQHDLFAATLRPVLVRAAGSGGPVRVFGEMVALLWAEGRREAALELEDLWNALGAELEFALLCAYPTRLLGGPAALGEVCCRHDVTRRQDAPGPAAAAVHA
jgi:diguanylate cyclase (GGDEF)-like protein